MAITPISTANTAQTVAQATATSNKSAAQAPPPEKKPPAQKQQPVTDTVNISSQAKAASEETQETNAEKAKEAAPGGREE